MRAATFTDYGEPLAIEEVDDPEPAPDGAVVALEACGVCRSDWHAWHGGMRTVGVEYEPGHVFGHEPAGTVVEVGPQVDGFEVGDHVAVPFNVPDGSCPQCRAGRSNLCEEELSLGMVPGGPGAWAEELAVPHADDSLVRLPDGVSSIDMAGLGCRFMTAYHGLADRAEVRGGDWVAVHGCGGVGQSAVNIANALGARVVAVDLDDDKLERAKSLGAVETVDAAETDDVPGAVQALTGGGAHVAVDALGIPETCRNAVSSLRTRGQHVQIGMSAEHAAGIDLPVLEMVAEEVAFLGSFGMPVSGYPEVFSMMEAGTIDPAAVVSETIDLEGVSGKLDAMTTYDTKGIPVIDSF